MTPNTLTPTFIVALLTLLFSFVPYFKDSMVDAAMHLLESLTSKWQSSKIKVNTRIGLYRDNAKFSEEIKEYAEIFGIDGNSAYNIDTHDILCRGRRLQGKLTKEGVTDYLLVVRNYIKNGRTIETAKPVSTVVVTTAVSHAVRKMINNASLIVRETISVTVGRIEGGDRDGEPTAHI